MITIRLMITPINMIPSVEPISDIPSSTGVGICNEMDAAVFCAEAKDGLKFATTSANTMTVNKKAMPKIWVVFIVC